VSQTQTDVGIILKALKFAAEKHRQQRRKDADKTPYINHPIEVAEILSTIGRLEDASALAAAILHDTIEDTATTAEELKQAFGDDILSLVLECTDDRSLPKAERKRLQEVNASHKSERAKQIKIADKISNVKDLTHSPPADWSYERCVEYLNWTERVVSGLRGVNPQLDSFYDQVLTRGRKEMASKEQKSD
jgi:guanosine-3',5'-bis(diphosphate) 3'-pyrophosphohydrolase